jgi:methyl-accepting chemotaxis protein
VWSGGSFAISHRTLLWNLWNLWQEQNMTWFNNLKIGKKLALGFGVVLVLMVFTVVFAIKQLAVVNATTVDMETNWMPSVKELGYMKVDVLDFRRQELNILVSRKMDPQYLAKMADLEKDLEAHDKTFAEMIASEEERRVYEHYRSNWEKATALHKHFLDLCQHGKWQAAAGLTLGEGRSTTNDVLAVLDEDLQLQDKGAAQAAHLGAKTYSKGRMWSIVLLIAALVFGVVVATRVAGSTSRATNDMLRMIQEIASSNLAIPDLDVHSEDEIGKAVSALNGMKRQLATVVKQIASTAEQVASASEEISAGATQTAESSRNQSDQTHQAATAMQEMSSTVQQISDNCQKAANTSHQASEAAQRGGSVVEATLSAMRNIADATSKTAVQVVELGKGSEQIGKIIGVIDDIADQTNLLALNAAIEAARAGEQGRGFAVVADEVRKLAERTTKATKEIAGMIEAIQSETRSAVQAMERGKVEVEVGVEKTSASGAALQEIVKMSEQVGDMISQIATAATEQSATTEQINANVAQISSATEESSAAADQTAKACTDLSSLAFDLQKLVSQFRLDSTTQVVSLKREKTARQPKAKAAAAAAGARR